jgi:hypothetical protein
MIYKSLVHKLEYTVRELLGAGMTEQEIHSLVAMTLNDWLVDGDFTEQYRSMASQALALRETIENTPEGPQIVNINGNPII